MPANLLYQTDIEGIRYEVYDGRPEIENLTFLKQIHSSTLVHRFNECAEADGFFIKERQNRAFAIVTADCMPVVALGRQGVAFVHAGWKGVQKNILSYDNISELEPYHVFFGPHINGCCYEVGAEFKEYFPNSHSFENRNGKLYFSLSSQMKSQLENDFHMCTMSESNICTHCQKNFHSYRRDNTEKRNWNILYY